MHPRRLRCSSIKYGQYSQSSRLVSGAPRRPRCDAGLSPRTARARREVDVVIANHGAALVVITVAAAFVNGALGYGFSSITVPLALLFLSNRVLNPALVLIEVALNTWVLWVNRASLPIVWRRVFPIVVGLAPGVIVGTAIVSQVNPG